jgi:hypothetical protein
MSPILMDIKDLVMELLLRNVTKISPIIIRPKNSGGPKRRAKSVIGCARRQRKKTLRVPAINEPIADTPKAGPALPCLAI